MAHDNADGGQMHSRSRPRDPVLAVLRELRSAVRGHVVVLDTALAALESIEGRPEITYVISALRVATRRRGSSFGTAHSITVLLDGLLGESGYAPDEEPTT